MASLHSALLAGTLLALVAAPVAAQSHAPVPPRDWPAYTAPLTDPAWRLTAGPDTAVVEAAGHGAFATLAFDMGVGVGSTGCNGFVAPVTFTELDGIHFDHVAPNVDVCPGPLAGLEADYLALLPQVSRWLVAGNVLNLSDAAGSSILVYAVLPVPSLEGTWNVSVIAGPDGTQVDLLSMPVLPIAISFTGGQVSTTVGCNGVGGDYTQDGPAFHFTAGPATQMYCDGLMDAETALRAALSDSVTVRALGDTMELLDAAGYTRLVIGTTHGPEATPSESLSPVSPAP